MVTQTDEARLYRSRDAFVGGVCAGIAERFDLDPIVVRILGVFLAGLTFGLAGIVYLVLWAQLPQAPEASAPYDVRPESAESSAYGLVDLFPKFEAKGEKRRDIPLAARLAVAAGLMLLFLAVAVNVSPLVPGTEWWQYWPLGTLIAGLCFIVIPIRSRSETLWHALGIVVTSLSVGALPMSVGVVSWETVPHTLETLWPIVLLALALFCVGVSRGIDVLVLASAFCVVALCLLGAATCIMPGEVSTLMLHAPDGRSIQVFVMR